MDKACERNHFGSSTQDSRLKSWQGGGVVAREQQGRGSMMKHVTLALGSVDVETNSPCGPMDKACATV